MWPLLGVFDRCRDYDYPARHRAPGKKRAAAGDRERD